MVISFSSGGNWSTRGEPQTLVLYCHFHQYFSYIMMTSFSGEGNWSTRREPLTMGKQLVNFITCGSESSAPFFIIYKVELDSMLYW